MRWLHNTVNALDTTELYTSKRLTVCDENCSSVFKKCTCWCLLCAKHLKFTKKILRICENRWFAKCHRVKKRKSKIWIFLFYFGFSFLKQNNMAEVWTCLLSIHPRLARSRLGPKYPPRLPSSQQSSDNYSCYHQWKKMPSITVLKYHFPLWKPRETR